MTLPIQYAKDLFKQIEQISPSLFKVGEHSVKIQTKKGRQLLLCSCINHSKFCVESPICVHKLSVILYTSDNNFHQKIDKVISDYKKYQKINMNIKIDLMIDDLENLKRVK